MNLNFKDIRVTTTIIPISICILGSKNQDYRSLTRSTVFDERGSGCRLTRIRSSTAVVYSWLVFATKVFNSQSIRIRSSTTIVYSRLVIDFQFEFTFYVFSNLVLSIEICFLVLSFLNLCLLKPGFLNRSRFLFEFFAVKFC